VHRLSYYQPTGPINHALALTAALAAAQLPRPALIFVSRRIVHVARTTRRPRLRRYSKRLTWLVVGDAISIQARNRTR